MPAKKQKMNDAKNNKQEELVPNVTEDTQSITSKLVGLLKNNDHMLKEAQEEFLENLRTLLSDKSHLIIKDYKDENNDTLMHLAARNYKVTEEVIRKLYKLGCPVDSENNAKKKPAKCFCTKNKLGSFIGALTKNSDLAALKDISNAFNVSDLFVEKIYFYYAAWKAYKESIKNKKRTPVGRYVTSDLNLVFSTKRRGELKIPNQWQEFDQKDNLPLTLHQRLAMAQPFAICNTTDCSQLYKNATNNNFLTVNLGFLVSKKTSDEKGLYHDQFITIPITDLDWQVLRNEPKERAMSAQTMHSESGLYQYLNDVNKLRKIVATLYDNYNITEEYKIHVVILDMHSTRDMCSACQEKAHKLLANKDEGDNFLSKLEKLLEGKYKLPKEKRDDGMILVPKTRKLHFVIRMSAQEEISLDYVTVDGYSYSTKITKNVSKDVRKYCNSVIVHDDTNSSKERYNFFTSSTYKNLNSNNIVISKQTAFVNYCSTRSYENIKRQDTTQDFKCKLSL